MRWILRRMASDLDLEAFPGTFGSEEAAKAAAEADNRSRQRLEWVRQGRTLVARASVGVGRRPDARSNVGLHPSGTSQDLFTTRPRTSLHRQPSAP
jgi:hypothetical protein